MQAGSASLVWDWQSCPGGWQRSAVGGLEQAYPCCLSAASHPWLPTSASMLHTLCGLLMLCCLLLQASAGGPGQLQHGTFRSQRLHLQSADGALPPAAPIQNTGRAALPQWQPTLEVPCLPSGELTHRCADTVRPLTACIDAGPGQISACRH